MGIGPARYVDAMAPPAPRIQMLAGGVSLGVLEGVPELPGTTAGDLGRFDVLVTDLVEPPSPWVSGSPEELERAAAASPEAAAMLAQVLRATEHATVRDALVVESMAYSLLQHGEVFRAWLEVREPRSPGSRAGERIELERHGNRLEVSLARPEVHNAFDAATRDALLGAFDLVDADPDITEVHLRGRGRSFCSGGDLAEFGLARDPLAAHRLRVERSVGLVAHQHAPKVTAHLHGHCIGAGIELAAFAGTVLAAEDTSIRLPELALGLVPGAGGTVSLPRRIGRHRTAWLALSGSPLDARTAMRWGLVDGLE